jgi:UPF0755 protein
VADDLNRDDTSPAQPEDAARVRLPPAPAYVPPTRRQLRESEARAKEREKNPRRASNDAPAPLVAPPVAAPVSQTAAAAAAARVTQSEPVTAHATAEPPSRRRAEQPPAAPRRAEPAPDAAPAPASTSPAASASESRWPAAATSTSLQAPDARRADRRTGASESDDGPLTVDDLFGQSGSDAAWPPPAQPTGKKTRKRKRRWLIWLWIFVVLFGLVGGVAAAAWILYEDQVREVLGIELPNDYEGTGNGEEVTVTIVAGDVGGDIATKLQEAGVTMTYDAFYDLLVAQEVQPSFIPGSYPLQKEMSAQSALDVLVNSANIVTSRVLVIEGSTLSQTLAALSEGTGLPLSDFETAAADYTAYGVPATAPNMEGWLFPATYDFEPGVAAPQILQTMVDRMVQSLDAAGVAVDDRERVLTLASIVQKEGGSVEDFPIVARLFQNRLALPEPMNLESDATVAYGTGSTSIFTTDDEREDASNPYNTYANPGLPVGPISAPGDDAINAVMNPAEGNWLYMVLINGDTGETAFNDTFEEHLEDVAVFQEWIQANPDWDN